MSRACITVIMVVPNEVSRHATSVDASKLGMIVHRDARLASPSLLRLLRRLVPNERLFIVSNDADLSEAVDELAKRGADPVVCGGGDGTFARITTMFAARHPKVFVRFAVLPLGTGNAVGHWVSSRDPIEAVLGLCRAKKPIALWERHVPLITRSQSRQLFCFGGLGYDSLLLNAYNRTQTQWRHTFGRRMLTGLGGYIWALARYTLPELWHKTPLLQARIRTRQKAYRLGRYKGPTTVAPGSILFEGALSLLAMGTCPFYGYGLTMFPFVGKRTNTMQLRLATAGPAQVLAHLPALWRGSWQPDEVIDFAVTNIDVELTAPFPLQIAGDDAGPMISENFALGPSTVRLLDFRSRARH